MLRIRALGALTAALALAGPLPARADDPVPTLTDRIDSAIAGATSYRVMVVDAPDGLTLEIHSFGPDRIHVNSSIGSVSSESIVVGNAMYFRNGAGDWKTTAVPLVKRVRKNRLYMGTPDSALVPLDDRTEAGVVLGAFRSPALANGNVTGTMDCTYDKASYRPRTCMISIPGMSATVRVTYDRWDDPANAVEPPAGVAPPTPAPTRLPLPSASRPPVPGSPGAPH